MFKLLPDVFRNGAQPLSILVIYLASNALQLGNDALLLYGLSLIIGYNARGFCSLPFGLGSVAVGFVPGGSPTEIGECLKMLPDVVLDGELLILDKTGRPQFDRLSRRLRLKRPEAIARASIEEPTVIFAFDILSFNGKDLRSDPLQLRKAVLKKVLKDSDRIRFVHHIGEEGEKLFAEAEKLGLEGIVAKREISTYPRGRTSEWVKIKTSHGRHVDEERAEWN